jgi:translation initiation factor 2 gamma subunit (eIF-2gamma)
MNQKEPVMSGTILGAIYMIAHAPTIDAEVVRHGEWEVAIGYDPNKKVQCQNCYKMSYEPTPYCPNCGCKIDWRCEKSQLSVDGMDIKIECTDFENCPRFNP